MDNKIETGVRKMGLVDIETFLDVNKTIAKFLFDDVKFPWEVLPKLKVFIEQLGPYLPPEVYEKRGENIWIAKSAKVAETASIAAPCIIDEGAEIRHCAFIRGSVIVGKNAVVGNSTELKNALLFDGVQVPHYNYVGDSILGYKAHFGAGAITSNVKNDKTNVVVKLPLQSVDTGLRKFGAIVGDNAQVGCNSVLNPGTMIGRDTSIYPLSCVRGIIQADSIVKNNGKVMKRLK